MHKPSTLARAGNEIDRDSPSSLNNAEWKASRLKQKGLDRKTNLQDLMKIETEEIFVLTEAKVGGTKNWRKQSKLLSIRRSGSTRSRKETNGGNRGSMLWLGGGEETPPLFGPQQQYQKHSQQND